MPRLASAVAKPVFAPGSDEPRAPMPAPPSSRGSLSSNKSERRRSLPEPAKLPDGRAHAALPRTIYERRRSGGLNSPPVALGSARSTHSTHSTRSERGARERMRDPGTAAGSPDETLSLQRLRSNSGLSLHTNSAALRRYTDYNADGSTRLPPADERLDGSGRHGEHLPRDGGPLSPGIVRGTPTTPKLLSWETVRAILDDPAARQRFLAYTRAHGGTESLDFLHKVDQYNTALHTVTAMMASISTTYTCVTATEPLNLPPQLSKALNTDVKHVSSSILPGLEMLFGDVRSFVQERVVRHVYPDFAKHQLVARMKGRLGAVAVAAGAAPTPFRFEGLGRAFCLTDPYRPGNPVVYASDAFAHVLGYARSEDMPRTGRFFRGAELTHEEACSEELVLTRNHRDNRPFWSLVSGCPLKTTSGRVRFVLSGLVDVTDAVKSKEDIIRVMAADVEAGVSERSSDGTSAEALRTGLGSINGLPPRPTEQRPTSSAGATHNPPSRPRLARSEKSSSSAKSFFHSFSRRRRSENAAPPPSRDGASTETPCTEAPPGTAQTVTSPRAGFSPALSLSMDDKMPLYARLMVLQFVPGTCDEPDYNNYSTAPPPSRRSSRYGSQMASSEPLPSAVSRLKVAFSSLPMLDLLGLGPAAQDAVMYHDVFSVLSELAGSPSITPAFRATVRQRVITSESASLELYVPASGAPAPGVFSAGLGAGLASPANYPAGTEEPSTSTTSRRASLLLSGRAKQDVPEEDVAGPWRRRSGTYDQVPTSGQRGGREPARMQRLMSHWTPLKDGDGTVAWVILVMAPAA